MLTTLGFGTLLMPINNGLIGYAICVIQNLGYIRDELNECDCTYFKDLRECLDNSCILITVQLDDVDKSDLRFRTETKWFKNGSIFLVMYQINVRIDKNEMLTPTSRKASPSIWSGRAPQSTEPIRPCQMHCTSSVSGRGVSAWRALVAAIIC